MGIPYGNIILISVGILLILFIVLVSCMFLMVRYWRRKTRSDLQELRGDLRRLQVERKIMMDTALAYSKEDPEPYGALVEVFQTRMETIEGQVTSLEYQHVALQEHMRRISSVQWRNILFLPYLGYQARRDVSTLKIDLDKTQAAMRDVSRDERVISGIGWEVALEARAVLTIQQQLGEFLSHLRTKGIHGDLMDAAIQREENARSSINQIPYYFISGEEKTVLDLADKETISFVYDILQNVRPGLVELKADAENWEKNYQRTEDKVAELQRMLASTEDQISRMSPKIELSFERTQLDQFKFIYENLLAALSRIEVESMADVIGEIFRVTRTCKDLETELKRGRRHQAALEVAIPKLTDKLNNLSALLTKLGTHPAQPIAWTVGTAALTNLTRQAAGIGDINSVRSLEEIEQNLDLATSLNTECDELNYTIQQTGQQHVELLALYDTLDLSQVEQWLKFVQNLVVQVGAYNPKNWTLIDGVRDLPDELDAFEEDARRLLPSEHPETIQDTEIPHRLNATRDLSARYNILKRRINNIQKRLMDVEGSERAARERLETAETVSNQLSFIISSNNFLMGIAKKEITRIQGEIHKLNSEMSTRPGGTIESMNRTVSALVSKFELYANRWLNLLTEEVKKNVNVISASLEELDEICSLDERVVFQARYLVDSGASMSPNNMEAEERISLEKVVAVVKPCSEFWQSCNATLLALDDVKKPILESYSEMTQNRQNVIEQFADIDTWLPPKRTWPPFSESVKPEREQLDSVEKKIDSLRGEHLKAIALVARLGKISARYQTLAERVSRIDETIHKDQEQILEIESDIDTFVQQWKSQLTAYSDNPAASKEIREMLEEVDSERSKIKRQYQKGKTDYSQVVSVYRMLKRKVGYFQVGLEKDRDPGINGREIRRQ